MELLSGWMKVHKILHVIFETTGNFFFKLRSWGITLLYFLSWKFILFWRRVPINVPIFRLSISPNLYLDRLFCLKYIKFQLKSAEELCLMTLKIDANFEEKLTCGLENNMKNLANSYQNIWTLGLKIGTFMGYFYPK